MTALWLLGVLAGGCGGGVASQAAPEQPTEMRVVLVLGDGNWEAVEGEAVERMVARLEALFGHSVQLELRTEMMPRGRFYFLRDLVELSLPALVEKLEALAAAEPEVFARARAVETLVLDYDGSRSRPSVELGDEGRRLYFVLVDSRVPDPAPALVEAHHEDQWRRFDGLDPDAVADDQLAAYVGYLTGAAWDSRPDVSERAAWTEGPRPWAVLRALGLLQGNRLRQEDRRQLRDFMTGAGADFVFGVHAHWGRHLLGLSAEAPVVRAERAFGSWLAGDPGLTDAQWRRLLPRLLVEPTEGPHAGERYVVGGGDFLSLHMRIVDRWIEAGMPRAASPDSDAFPGALFEHVVCPFRPMQGDVEPDEGHHCRDNRLVVWALSNPEYLSRWLLSVYERRNPDLMQSVAWLIIERGTAEQVAQLFAGEQAGAPIYRAMVSAAAPKIRHDRRGDQRSAAYAEAVRGWRRHPERRGSYLFYWAVTYAPDHHGRGTVQGWAQLPAELGGPITRPVFEDYLAHGALAVTHAGVVWPALAESASNAAVLWPHLRIELEASAIGPRPIRALMAVLEPKERAALQRELAGWVRAHPREEPMFRGLLEAGP